MQGECTAVEFNSLSKGQTLFTYVDYPLRSFFRSDDHGVTWHRDDSGLTKLWEGRSLEVKQILCLPLDTSVLLLATNHGIYRKERLQPWRRVVTNDQILGEAIAYSQSDGVLYYGQHYQKSVWRSSDSGKTWTVVGPKDAVVNLCCLAVSPVDAKLLVAGSNEGGIATSRDGGITWYDSFYRSFEDSAFQLVPEVPKALFLSQCPSRIYVTRWLAADGLVMSSDGGTSWRGMATGKVGRAWALVVDEGQVPCKPLRMWLGLFEVSKGVHSLLESRDAGASWYPLPSPYARRVWTLRYDTTTFTLAAATSSGLLLMRR